MNHDVRVDTRKDTRILWCAKCGKKFGEWKSNEQLKNIRSQECKTTKQGED